jgi:acyl dehydratase
MAIRGVYSREEQKMLEQWRSAEQNVGWLGDDPVPHEITYPVFHRAATKDLILNMANGIQDPNPLWRNERYAGKTRWGTIIAPPYFEHCITHLGRIPWQDVPPEVGVPADPLAGGIHWEFFKPIRLGDAFRVWCGSPTCEDKTRKDGKGPRMFLITGEMRYFNQKDELVCIRNDKVLIMIMPLVEKGQEPAIKETMLKMEEYKYTKEELDSIERTRSEEIIRGDQIRWWEDVNVSDDLQPIVNGPTTLWDQLMEIAGLGINVLDMSRVRRLTPQATVLDPETGVWHKTIERHLVDKTARLLGDPQAIMIGTMMEHTLGRLITNWMGDDGFLKMTDFQNRTAVPMGDTVFGRGKVIRKYVQEDGEHVVDVACWLEGIRGFIHTMGTAKVGLLSRESIHQDLQRY